MSIKLKIEVDSTWVFSHGDDEVLPVDYLKKTLENTFGEKLTVDDSTFTELYVTINSDEINVASNKLANPVFQDSVINPIFSIGVVLGVTVGDIILICGSIRRFSKILYRLYPKISENPNKLRGIIVTNALFNNSLR